MELGEYFLWGCKPCDADEHVILVLRYGAFTSTFSLKIMAYCVKHLSPLHLSLPARVQFL